LKKEVIFMTEQLTVTKNRVVGDGVVDTWQEINHLPVNHKPTESDEWRQRILVQVNRICDEHPEMLRHLRGGDR